MRIREEERESMDDEVGGRVGCKGMVYVRESVMEGASSASAIVIDDKIGGRVGILYVRRYIRECFLNIWRCHMLHGVE